MAIQAKIAIAALVVMFLYAVGRDRLEAGIYLTGIWIVFGLTSREARS